MKIDMQNPYELRLWGLTVKHSIYINLDKQAKQWPIAIRLTGLGVGIQVASIDFIMRIATLGEVLIKGIGNVLGCCFVQECSLLTGIKQLAVDLPWSLLYLISWPITTPIKCACLALGILIAPHMTVGISLSMAYHYEVLNGDCGDPRKGDPPKGYCLRFPITQDPYIRQY
jgi:hypothetical protein